MTQSGQSGVAVAQKRVYDEPDPSDGVRVLVDRLWPRGLTKERAHVDMMAEGCRAEPGVARMVRARSREVRGVSPPLRGRACG